MSLSYPTGNRRLLNRLLGIPPISRTVLARNDDSASTLNLEMGYALDFILMAMIRRELPATVPL